MRRSSDLMATTTTGPRRRVREPQVSRTYRVPLTKLKAGQRALSAATAAETIERALDMVVFQRDLIRGTRTMAGVEIASSDATERKSCLCPDYGEHPGLQQNPTVRSAHTGSERIRRRGQEATAPSSAGRETGCDVSRVFCATYHEVRWRELGARTGIGATWLESLTRRTLGWVFDRGDSQPRTSGGSSVSACTTCVAA